MKCMMCNGEMDKKAVPYSVDRKGYHLYLREIPAWVCSQCGEKYFGESEIDLIQHAIRTLELDINKLKAA